MYMYGGIFILSYVLCVFNVFQDLKPQVINDYNHTKGGVDVCDQMLDTYR